MKVSNIRQSQESISNIHNIRHILERSEESKMNLMVHLKKTQTISKAFIKTHSKKQNTNNFKSIY